MGVRHTSTRRIPDVTCDGHLRLFFP